MRGSVGVFRRFVAATLTLLAAAAFAQEQPASSFDGFRIERTEHFQFIYEPRDRAVVDRLLGYAEEVYLALDPYLPYDPKRIPVVIRGRTDQANGYMTFAPRHISIFVASPSEQFIGARTESWIRAVFVHELAHFLHLTEPLGIFGSLGAVFGDLLTAWNALLLPGWMVEGITTNIETLLTEGGRGRNPFFELQYKAPILEDEMFGYTQAGYQGPFPPDGRIYVAGYIMVDHLRRTYGDDAFYELYRLFTRWPFYPFGMSRAIRQLTGLSPRELFSDVVAELDERFDATVEFPSGRRWSPPGVGDWQLPVATERGLFSYRETPYKGPAVVRIDSVGTEEIVFRGRLSDSYSFSVDPSGRRLAATSFVQSTTHPSGPSFVNESVLTVVDLETGTHRVVPRVAGLHHPAVAGVEGPIVAVQRVGSFSRLVRVDPRTGAVDVLFEEAEVRVYNPAISPDGERIAFVVNRGGVQDIAVLEGGSPRLLTGPDRAGDYLPRWDGNRGLLFSSDREGYLAIYRVSADGGPAVRIIRDPIGAMAAEPVTAAQAGSVGYLYQAYSSEGWVVRFAGAGSADPAPELSGATGRGDAAPSDAAPSEVADRREPRGSTADVAGATRPMVASSQAGSPQAQLYGPLPIFHSWLPMPWLPTAWPEQFGDVPIGLGALAMAGDYLGTTTLMLQAGYAPAIRQPYGSVAVTKDFGRYTTRGTLRYTPDAYLPLGAFTTTVATDGAVLPTLYEFIDRRQVVRLQGLAGAVLDVTRFSPQPHAIADPPADSLLFRTFGATVGLAFQASERGLPSLAFYGADEVFADISIQAWPAVLDTPLNQVLVSATLGGALGTVRSQRIKLGARAAWGVGTSPAGVLSYRGNPGWEPPSALRSSVRAIATAEYQIPIALFDLPILGLGLTRVGASVFAETAASATSVGIVPDAFLVVGGRVEAPVTAGNLTLPFSLGVAARISYDREFVPQDDLTLLLSFLLVDVVVQEGDGTLRRLTPSGVGCTFQSLSWTSHSSSRYPSTTP